MRYVLNDIFVPAVEGFLSCNSIYLIRYKSFSDFEFATFKDDLCLLLKLYGDLDLLPLLLPYNLVVVKKGA